MAQLPTTEWEGTYFDGRSAHPRPVTVRVMSDGLHISGQGVKGLWWSYDTLRQTQGFHEGEEVRLERGEDPVEAIVVSDADLLTAIRRFARSGRGRFHNPSNRAARARLTLLAAAGVVLLGWLLYVWGIPFAADRAASLVPVSWERRLGRLVMERLAPTEKRCRDAECARAMDHVLSVLMAAEPDCPYDIQVTVVREPAINAFAAPGGYIVVYDGLLREAGSPDELAGVLAHEIQHVVLRHGTSSLFRQLSMQALLSAVTGDVEAMGHALDAAGVLGVLKYSREDEEAADHGGMRMIQAVRVDAKGMVRFFETLKRAGGSMPGGLQYLSTHPRTGYRIRKLEALADGAKYTPIELLPDSTWARIRAICRARSGKEPDSE